MKEYRGIFLSEPQEPEPDGAGRIICLYFISPTAVVEINHFPAAVIGVGKEGADFFFRLVYGVNFRNHERCVAHGQFKA